MSYKIENIQWTIPVTGQSYTDARPVISGGSLDDIIEGAKSVAKAVGNDNLYARLSGEEKPLTEPARGQLEQLEGGILFDPIEHKYYKNGKELMSGSQFAHKFELDFPREAIAQKVANKDNRSVEDVLAGWDMKGEISLDYGSLIHKSMELHIKFGDLPSSSYLSAIVQDWAEQVNVEDYKSEVFVYKDMFCGRVDIMTENNIEDFKTGDIYKKINIHKDLKDKGFKSELFTLYTLQLNFYRMLTGKKKMFIWALEGEHWTKVEVPKVDDDLMRELIVWK